VTTNRVSYNITDMIDPPKKSASTGASVVGLLILIPITFILSAWNAFVLWKLYSWFVVPLGAPLLNWWHIWGLWMFITAVFIGFTPERPEGGSATATRIFGQAFAFAITLFVGWIISGQIQ